MARNFIILFNEKEGSTPLVQLLDNFDAVDVLHVDDEQGWEPFDAHNCGALPPDELGCCFDMAWDRGGRDRFDELNALYGERARLPLVPFDSRHPHARGFKMRFRPQCEPKGGGFWRLRQQRRRALRQFESSCFDAFVRNEVVVFFAVRQDLLRWALSKYHGDGTGKPGHIQFKLARKSIDRNAIQPIHVDLDAFDRLLADCRGIIAEKRALAQKLQQRGLVVHPLPYERFCDDRAGLFAELLAALELQPSAAETEQAFAQGTPLKKVHQHDIHAFVENADALLQRFGEPREVW